MNTLLVIASLCVAAFATPILNKDLDNDWALYKQVHTKSYSQEEEQMRRLIWEDNVHYIQKHNLAADRGEHTFWLGQNEYADMTIFEFRAIMNGYIMSANRTKGQTYLSPSNIGDLPDSVDWRNKGYVTPIKNQGHCGSCWSFSATGSLEGQHFKADNKLVSLSEQNLVDCSQREGNHGCKGGLMDNAFRYIEQNKGIDTEESYPYKAKDGLCKFKESDVGATDTGFVDIPHQSEEKLAEAVATVGPISVAMDAGHKSFQLYKEGVYKEPACSSTKLDHGVLAVGYGSNNGNNYWIVKNSWGTSWGMQGFFMMAKDDRNMCGIATQASYPKV
ncbi:procathepsin L-like [Ostrea edulis]|uniref:procathepsin L-like n=1 Tax=Ostrea edulis TaxID=37623 RepID=UPI0024AF6E50|nr:procathepsin L-like [Ostrea edulis]